MKNTVVNKYVINIGIYVSIIMCSAKGQWSNASNGIYYNDGNVGIGTVQPISKFHIKAVDLGSNTGDKDVGNNQAVLLKKIEELTLYIIQQDKRIRELEGKK